MAARIALALSVGLLCLMLGWVSAPPPQAAVTLVRPLHVSGLSLDPAAPRAADAATALAGGAPRPTPSSATSAPAQVHVARLQPLPPPPPPQADSVLRSSVEAVTEAGGRLDLVLAGGRRLSAGERFMGWTVASVSRTGAVLSREGVRREVSFFAPGAGSGGAGVFAPGAGSTAATLPARRGVAPSTRAPTAEEYFRGFKG